MLLCVVTDDAQCLSHNLSPQPTYGCGTFADLFLLVLVVTVVWSGHCAVWTNYSMTMLYKSWWTVYAPRGVKYMYTKVK